MTGDPSEQVEARVAAFPLQWDEASWEAVTDDPEGSIAEMTDAVLRLEVRLTSHIPDAATHSALIVVEGIVDVSQFRSVVTPRVGGGATWIPWRQWFAVPHAVGGRPVWVEQDLILGRVNALGEIYGAMVPRSYTCSECNADLSRGSHRPDCKWR